MKENYINQSKAFKSSLQITIYEQETIYKANFKALHISMLKLSKSTFKNDTEIINRFNFKECPLTDITCILDYRKVNIVCH